MKHAKKRLLLLLSLFLLAATAASARFVMCADYTWQKILYSEDGNTFLVPIRGSRPYDEATRTYLNQTNFWGKLDGIAITNLPWEGVLDHQIVPFDESQQLAIDTPYRGFISITFCETNYLCTIKPYAWTDRSVWNDR